MDTPKYANWIKIVHFKIILSIVILSTNVSFSKGSGKATTILSETYNLNSVISTSEAESIIDDLEKVLKGCTDNYLVYRIRYRIGVIYFKTHLMKEAKESFMQIVDSSECPELIKISSLNMIGQISRLEGKNKEALQAFNKVGDIIELNLTNDAEFNDKFNFIKLLSSIQISCAEIHELQQDYQTSIDQYNRILVWADEYKTENILNQYLPLIKDRISQLYLKLGNIDKYIAYAEDISKDSFEYERIPIIKLELECIKFLNSLGNSGFENGSFSSPALLIAHIKQSEDKTNMELPLDEFIKLCEEYENTYGGVILKYHYAWLLDALGEQDKAQEIFAEISSLVAKDMTNSFEAESVIATVQQYSKIQDAIMAGEKADYTNAWEKLNSISSDSNDPHITELKKTVSESIQILKREVPYENE